MGALLDDRALSRAVLSRSASRLVELLLDELL